MDELPLRELEQLVSIRIVEESGGRQTGQVCIAPYIAVEVSTLSRCREVVARRVSASEQRTAVHK
jgi:hypothetical protein